MINRNNNSFCNNFLDIHIVVVGLSPNKAGVFKSSFFWGLNVTPFPPLPFQEEPIQY